MRIAELFAFAAKEKPPLAGGGDTHDEQEIIMLRDTELSKSGATTVAPEKHSLRFREGRLMVTPELAQRILAEANYEGQRRVDARHVRALANLIHRGRWTEGTQVHLAKVGDAYHLVDGQHRLHAVVQAAAAVEFTMLLTECHTAAQVAQLYYRHDIVRRPRNIGDVVRATGISRQNDLSDSDARRVLAAVLLIASQYRYVNNHPQAAELKSPDARLEIARPWWPHARSYLAAISAADKTLKVGLTRQAVMAVGLMTFKHQAEKAEEFWTDVARDDGLRKGDPRKTIIRWMQEATMRGDSRMPIWARAAALCWNAHFEGRQLTMVRAFADSPLVIAGTPVGRSRKKS